MCVERILLRRRVFFHPEDRPQHRGQEHHPADVERQFHRGGNLAFRRGVRDVKPVGERIRQQRRDDRAHADEKRLHGKSLGALFIGQHIADERTEWLHRDVDGPVHQPQRPGRDPQGRRIRHHEQRQRGQNGAREEIRFAAAKTIPRFVAHVANDGLDQQPGHRRRDPQNRDVVHLGVLQREAELDAHVAEAHVPELPET